MKLEYKLSTLAILTGITLFYLYSKSPKIPTYYRSRDNTSYFGSHGFPMKHYMNIPINTRSL